MQDGDKWVLKSIVKHKEYMAKNSYSLDGVSLDVDISVLHLTSAKNDILRREGINTLRDLVSLNGAYKNGIFRYDLFMDGVRGLPGIGRRAYGAVCKGLLQYLPDGVSDGLLDELSFWA